jgi:hypothetical protein
MNSLRSFLIGALTGTGASLALCHYSGFLGNSSSELLVQSLSECEKQLSTLCSLTRHAQAREATLAAIQDLLPSAAEFQQSKVALQADLKTLMMEVRMMHQKIDSLSTGK